MIINDIYNRLEEILANKNNVRPETLGSYIVGCTIVPDGIESFYAKYPALGKIADLGSDLEIANYGNGEDGYYYLSLITQQLGELKREITNS